MNRFGLLIAAIALVAGACGGGEDDAAALPVSDGDDQSAIDAACLVDEPECDDTPTGEPQDLPPPGNTDEEPVLEMLAGDVIGATGRVAVTGFLVATDEAARLCEALAESFPPQCGGDAIPLSDYDQVDPDELRSEGSVTWTDLPVTIRGEVIAGALRADPAE